MQMDGEAGVGALIGLLLTQRRAREMATEEPTARFRSTALSGRRGGRRGAAGRHVAVRPSPSGE